MLLILAPSASSWSEKPKSTLVLEFGLSHRAVLEFLCGDPFSDVYAWVRRPHCGGRPNITARQSVRDMPLAGHAYGVVRALSVSQTVRRIKPEG